jgi:hypothetical protein
MLLLAIVCNLATNHHAYSQRKFHCGYIINLEGDTITGLIHLKRNKLISNLVYFKDQALRKEILYTPIEVKSFAVKDERYKSAVVEKCINNYLCNAQALKQDTVFLQVLVSGKKSLFRWEDTHGKTHYFIHKGDTFQRLYFRDYPAKNKSNQVKENQENYKNQLKEYLQDCSSIAAIIDQTKPSYRSLLKLFVNYYACTQTKPEYIRTPKNVTAETSLIAGSTNSK